MCICSVQSECLFCFPENNCTYNDPVGRLYMGKKFTTVSNKRCVDWSNQRAYSANTFPDDSYHGASNYCRNPTPHEDRTWCYWHDRRWDFCLLENCGNYYYYYHHRSACLRQMSYLQFYHAILSRNFIMLQNCKCGMACCATL